MRRNWGERHSPGWAKTAERPREPHSTSGVDSANDMSDSSVSTPSSRKKPIRWGYVVRLQTWRTRGGVSASGRACVGLGSARLEAQVDRAHLFGVHGQSMAAAARLRLKERDALALLGEQVG